MKTVRHLVVLLAFAFLGFTSPGFVTLASAQSEASLRHKVIGCAQEPRGECVGNECSCSRWIIEWRDAGGRVWGVSEAKSLQKLIADRDRDLTFERAYASFFHAAFDQKFANPSQPICDGCRPSAPSGATRSGSAAIQTAASLYDEWSRKVAEGMLSLTNVIFGGQPNSPYRSSGTVLRDYANAMRLVNMKLKHLRQDMSYTERELGRLTGNLEGSTAELRQATDAMTTAYAKLPSDVRNALEGKSSEKVMTTFSTPTSSAEIVGSKLVLRDNRGNGWLILDAKIGDLDVEASKVWNRDGQWNISFNCRREPNGQQMVCFNASDFPSYEQGESVSCGSREQCEAFLSALRRASKPNR